MAETLTPEEEAAAARAAEQARLRKARREAKIKAGAENRLNKITGLSGGFHRATPPAPAPVTTTATTATPDTTASSTGVATSTSTTPVARPQHADPEEVDISEHYYQPRTTPRVAPANKAATTTAGSGAVSDAQLRQAMLGFDSPNTASQGPSMPGMPPGMGDDPMMRMMMQMLGGGGGGGGTANNNNNNNNNNNSNPFGNGTPFPAQQPQQQQQQLATASPDRYASLWRLLHALTALALGLYIALYTPFTGTKLSRDSAATAAAGSAEERARLWQQQQQQQQQSNDDGDGDGGRLLLLQNPMTKNFFWAFATAEALLLGTRYLLFGRGSRSPLDYSAASGASSILSLVASFLPPGPKSRIEMVMRYGQVLGTIRHDLLVCLFVLGAATWLRG